jgi:IS5 family transposase
MYNNKTELGGRPNLDEMVMLKMLVLQQLHGLSDLEFERQATDRISCKDPDSTTDWAFRELSSSRKRG